MNAGIERGWQPEHTWVVVVGTLKWKHADMFDSFPQEHRRDAALVDFFRKVGVPQEQIVYLKDQQATLSRIEQALEEHLAQAQNGDGLFLYYCGHGYLLDSGEACFACYDAGDDGISGWQVPGIPVTVERHFKGSHAVLLADCCYSGCLADAASRRTGPVSYACITSSSSSELSTGNWTFTEALIAGLRGQAFTDSDNSATITLQELAEQIQGDMAFAEEQMASFITTGSFDPHMVLAPARRKPHPDVGRRVEVHSGGDWYKARVIDAKDSTFKVHYYGWEDSDDEWVTPEQIRDVPPVQYRVGERVEVRWKGEWYPAMVLDVRGGVHYICYDGYDEAWNEWVASKRMRHASA